MQNVTKILAAAVILTFSTQTYDASAATKVLKQGTITMQKGTRTGLQELYSWDERCKTVRMRIKPRSTPRGQVYVVRDRFVISKKQANKAGTPQCAGKTVSGYRVAFRAKKKGDTMAEYSIRSKTLLDTYVVRRLMRIQ